MKRILHVGLLVGGLFVVLATGCTRSEDEKVRGALADVGAGRFGEASTLLATERGDVGRLGLVELGERGSTTAVRVEAVRIVGQRNDPTAYRWLVSRTAAPENEVRAAAFVALGGLGVPFAIPLAAEAASDPDPAVAAAAKEAEAKLRESAIAFYLDQAVLAPSLAERLDGVNAIAQLRDPRAVAGLAGLFAKVNEAEMKQAILWCLGDIGGPDALAFVRRQLRSDEYLTRSAAIYVVGQHKDGQAVADLERIIKDDISNGNRIGACRALSSVGTPESVSILEKALAAGLDEEIRSECRIALKPAQKPKT